MTDAAWEDFILSGTAIGSRVVIAVPPDERQQWQRRRRPMTVPGMKIVQFDASVADGAVGIVGDLLDCGWLTVEIPDHGVINVPVRYLKQP